MEISGMSDSGVKIKFLSIRAEYVVDEVERQMKTFSDFLQTYAIILNRSYRRYLSR